jgi:hypothetical protein
VSGAVTRYNYGGVAGTESDRLNGVVGRVRAIDMDMIFIWISEGGGGGEPGIGAGLCGRERSYDIVGSTGPVGSGPRSISSNLCFTGSVGMLLLLLVLLGRRG